MARWTVTPRTAHNTMTGTINYDENGFQQEIVQDISEHVKDVQRAKEELAGASHKDRVGGFRRMATIPNVAAMNILQDHGLDIHDPEIMNNPAEMNRLRYILRTEYPYLLVST